MGVFKAKKPRANPPVCWICGRRLYGGGYFYVLVDGEDGHQHPAHASCVAEESP